MEHWLQLTSSADLLQLRGEPVNLGSVSFALSASHISIAKAGSANCQ